MILRLKRLFARIENLPIGWLGIFLIANAVIFLRVLTEGIFDSQTIFSYWTVIFWQSWFLSLFICFIMVIYLFSKTEFIKIARLTLAGLPIILLPAIALLFGKNRHFDFPQGSWSEILFNISTVFAFISTLGPVFTAEILIVLFAVFIFLILKTSFFKSLLGVIGIYAALVFFALQGKILNDLLNIFPTNLKISQTYAVINFFILIGFGFALFSIIAKSKMKVVIFNLRPERLLSFFIFGFLCFLGVKLTGGFFTLNFILSFALFIFFLFYAVLSNDVSDINIDKVSNPNRPYARGIFSKKEMSILQILVLLAIAILVLIIDSMPILIITAINIGLSILYSVFRFRKFLFSHLIAAAGESTVVLYGYFAQMPTSSFALVEALILFFAVFVFLAFFLPIKDLKDFAGDKKENVRNFLTVFSWRSGKILTAISVSLAYIFFAFIMGSPAFFVLSFFFAGLGAYFVVYYEKVGERASYINFLAFIVLFLLFSVA